jgi:arylsulfatase A-like enzyme
MKTFALHRIVGLLIAAAACVAGNVPAAAERRPNIIVILTDDLRFDALGFAGNSILRTPHIDSLAARGTVFTNSFCTTSICPVSRASLITGQYERRHGIADFKTPLTATQFAATFPALLRRNGYRTGFVGKWGLGEPLPHAEYDVFDGFPGQGAYFAKGAEGKGEHLTARQAAQAARFLEGCSAERPFHLQISTKAPHVQDDNRVRPFPPDPRHESLFLDVTVPKPRTATEAHFRALPEFLRESEARARWRVRFANDELYQRTVKDYYRLIVGIDELVGTVLDQLQKKKLADNTVIIFTSDNGFYLGDRGLAGKWFMHEESIRVPLVICDLRRPAPTAGGSGAKTRPEMVLNIDVAPTVLDLAGIQAPAVMQGHSLRPLVEGAIMQRQSLRPPVEGGEPSWRDRFFYEHRFRHPRIPTSEGVRTTRWKYVRYTSIDPVYEELYDLSADPLEEHDLAKQPGSARTLDDLRRQWRLLAKDAE